MIDFSSLKNRTGDNRRIREVCTMGAETITVFEPSREDVNKLLDMQEKIYTPDEESGDVSAKVDPVTLVREIFPMLTDVQGIDKLSDEELADVIENPSMALMMANEVIETIVIEVYKIVVLSSRKELLQADFDLEKYKFEKDVQLRIAGSLAKSGKLEDISEMTEHANGTVDQLSATMKDAQMKILTDEVEREEKLADAAEKLAVAEEVHEKETSAINGNKADMDKALERFTEAFETKAK